MRKINLIVILTILIIATFSCERNSTIDPPKPDPTYLHKNKSKGKIIIMPNEVNTLGMIRVYIGNNKEENHRAVFFSYDDLPKKNKIEVFDEVYFNIANKNNYDIAKNLSSQYKGSVFSENDILLALKLSLNQPFHPPFHLQNHIIKIVKEIEEENLVLIELRPYNQSSNPEIIAIYKDHFDELNIANNIYNGSNSVKTYFKHQINTVGPHKVYRLSEQHHHSYLSIGSN